MDAETTILLKNEDHNFEEICNLEHFNNCKVKWKLMTTKVWNNIYL